MYYNWLHSTMRVYYVYVIYIVLIDLLCNNSLPPSQDQLKDGRYIYLL